MAKKTRAFLEFVNRDGMNADRCRSAISVPVEEDDLDNLLAGCPYKSMKDLRSRCGVAKDAVDAMVGAFEPPAIDGEDGGDIPVPFQTEDDRAEADEGADPPEPTDDDHMRALVKSLFEAVEYKEWSTLEALVENATLWALNGTMQGAEMVQKLEKALANAEDLELQPVELLDVVKSEGAVRASAICRLVWSTADTWETKMVMFQLHLGARHAEDEADWSLDFLGLTHVKGVQTMDNLGAVDTSRNDYGGEYFGDRPAPADGAAYFGAEAAPAEGEYFGAEDPQRGAEYFAGVQPGAEYFGGAKPGAEYFGGAMPGAEYFGGTKPGAEYFGAAPSRGADYFGVGMPDRGMDYFGAARVEAQPAAPPTARRKGRSRFVMLYMPVFAPREMLQEMLEEDEV